VPPSSDIASAIPDFPLALFLSEEGASGVVAGLGEFVKAFTDERAWAMKAPDRQGPHPAPKAQ
jgi:hypothetical protein